MIAKERPGPGLGSLPVSSGIGSQADPVRAAAFAWEDWFRQATTVQQGQAIALAQRQGYVYAHQLPAPTDCTKPPPTSAPGDGLDGLRAMLAGKTEGLAAVAPRLLDQPDTSLSHTQHCAIARCTASPDVALLRSRPGQAVPVLGDIIIQAARAGQRVLLLTQHPALLDQVLQRLHGRDAVLPVRFLDPGESVAQLAANVRPYTLDAQRQLFQTNTLVKAQAGRAEAEDRCRRRFEEEPLWPQLMVLAEQHAALEERRLALQQRIGDTAGDVQREAEGIPGSGNKLPSGPFAIQIVELIKEFNGQVVLIDQAAHDLHERRSKLNETLAQLAAEQDALKPLVDAKRGGRWWSGAWWRAAFTKNLAGRAADLDQRHAEAQASLAALARELTDNAEQRRTAEAKLCADREALVIAESERRRREWTAQITAIAKEQAPLVAQWESLTSKIDRLHHPTALTPDAAAQAQVRWTKIKHDDEAACLFARQWATFVQESAPQFIAQLPRYASLLAGTINALAKNPDFAAFADGPFDLVIIDDADRLLENDLLRLARKGRRWLLVGQPSGGNGRPSSFDKLWQALHADPSARLAYRWGKEGERWRCELRPVATPERRHLETERLADFPEIELRILALPKTRPQLAQVVFPTGMTLANAKSIIHRELQEASIQPAGRGAWLEECERTWTVHLGAAAHAELVAVELEPGVREWISANGLTHRIDIDKSTWPLPQANEWLNHNLGWRDLGRTFELA